MNSLTLKQVILLVLLLSSSQSFAQIYKWTDSDGKVHYSDTKPRDGDAEELRVRVNSFESVSYDVVPETLTAEDATSEQVVMYSTSWCGYCKKAREYFLANGIDFVEYDIEKSQSAKRAYDELGGRGVPVILVGDRRMNGFSVAGFRRIYE